MVKLNKIYTRTGDDGSTGLADGSRVSKHSARVAAYGSVDEANSALGLARLHAGGDSLAMIDRIQNDLFDVGADLATPGAEWLPGAAQPEWPPLRTVPSQVARLEAEIDAMNAELSALNSFILPGGTALSAHLHLARAITRRAERDAVAASEDAPLNPHAIHYLNRLSDHLFVMARHANRPESGGEGDILWVPAKNR
ncbi:cob(I)yrinic acid a,c-diamide adenosyltransferase [Sandaracinobacter neustonicus]|uniref:Corrinoid adenosyltransferase n=1 Tax=Sandaracinobacter neustonicus TaxID=1715348 RepID=A0A501XIF3_9SPHN|nr:cob(I)yrinic acid a,c-diamide adenosyltransferase [Sandaracinobacter neustonicus]TPE60084.1 cob(I)yrinic acid a,c-diamide adenosyltransferase [Sandaracinobacter neustonicus]